MTETQTPGPAGAQGALCIIVKEEPYVVPPGSTECAGANFRSYWDQHNDDYDPDVELRVYKGVSSTEYRLYDAAKDDSSGFEAYHEKTPAGTNVRDLPGGPWVGIILDHSRMVMGCTMRYAPPYVVPVTSGNCKGWHFKNYWNQTPDVELRVYDADEKNYHVYDAARDASAAFAAYHSSNPPGTNVEGRKWVGIILDYGMA